MTPVHAGNPPGTHDPSNLSSTCTACHQRKSAAEMRERSTGRTR
ncbi:MAG: HNH endonuclease [Actinomycetota bacterium]|nr:HNH endonuclease [Actinomycetota bacterium]